MNRRRVALAIGISAVMVVVIAGILPREYLANDDVGFTEYLRQNTFTPWISPVLVRAFCWAYQVAPDVPWFGLYQYFLIFVTGAVLAHTCLELVDPRPGIGRSLLLIGTVIFIASHAILIVGITWTTVSISAIGTASIAFIAHVQKCDADKQPISRVRALVYGLLLVGGYMLRLQGLGANAAALAPLVAWAALRCWKRRYLPKPTTVLLFVAPFALVFAIQHHVGNGRGDDRVEWKKWTDQRGAIHGHYAYEGLDSRAPELVTQAGWTLDEYRDFVNWLIIDEDQYPTEKIERLLDTGGVPEVMSVAWSYRQLRGIFEDSKASVSLFLVAVAAGAVLAWLGIIRRREGFAFSLGYFAFLVAVPVWMSAHFRFPQRVSLSFYSVAALAVFVFIARLLADRPADADSAPRGDRRALVGFTLLTISLMVWARFLFMWLDRDIQPYRDARQALEDRITARGGFVFVYVQHGLVELDPLRARPRNYPGLQGGWGTFSLTWYELLQPLGVQRGTDVLRAMTDNPNAYVVAQLAARGGLEEWLKRKLHNPAARLALIDAADMPGGGRPELYRIVTTPVVRGSEEWTAMEKDEWATGLQLPGPPDVRDLDFRRVELPRSLTDLASVVHHKAARAAIEPIERGIRTTIQGDDSDDCESPGEDGYHAGVHFPVSGLAAARFHIELIDPQNIVNISVIARTKTTRSVRWRWTLGEQSQRFGFNGPVTLVPGYSAHRFGLALNTARRSDIRDLHVVIAVKPGTHAGFELRDLEVAEP